MSFLSIVIGGQITILSIAIICASLLIYTIFFEAPIFKEYYDWDFTDKASIATFMAILLLVLMCFISAALTLSVPTFFAFYVVGTSIVTTNILSNIYKYTNKNAWWSVGYFLSRIVIYLHFMALILLMAL